MKVNEIKIAAEKFISCIDAKNIEKYTIDFSKPWHFNESAKTAVPYSDAYGIYLFTNPANPWNIDIESNNEDVLYIGKSEGGIGGCVWQHVGLIYEPNSNYQLCNPRFKYHKWHKDNISEEVKHKIANGDIVIYSVKISPNDLMVNALEKYLLALYHRKTGKLPVLNRGI